MRTSIVLCAGFVLAAGCAGVRQTSEQPAALNAAYNDAALRPLPEDNPYDQPGQLPANGGGTDAGRIGADDRLGRTR